MDITRRCDYALRILEAAYRSGTSYVSVADISEKEDIPYAFARSIQHDLVKGGLIKTVRGARGGLALDCDPAKITLLEVLEAVQGPVTVSLCAVDAECCKRRGGCSYNKLWMGADSLLNSYFDSITLDELMERGGDLPAIKNAISHAPERARMNCPVDSCDDRDESPGLSTAIGHAMQVGLTSEGISVSPEAGKSGK